MKNTVRSLVLLTALIIVSSTSSAQTNNDKAIFERVFKESTKTEKKDFKSFRQVSSTGKVVITHNDGTEKSYHATRMTKAKRANFEGFEHGELVYLFDHRSLIKGYYQGIEDNFILLKVDEKIQKFVFLNFWYILTEAEDLNNQN